MKHVWTIQPQAKQLPTRFWGATEHHPFLHFELCYYQAIDYAIAQKLPREVRTVRTPTSALKSAICIVASSE